ncbi:hypothetical protein EON80_31265 [bacterium]|nr:MAG: hypothetical protein EON80_31265 [bacterium]
MLGTEWNTNDIWLRRTFNPGPLTNAQIKNLVIRDYHDDDVEVYINGVLAYKRSGYTSTYESRPLTPQGKAAIKPNSQNVMAIHCRQTGGGQYIDAGLSLQLQPKKP